MAMAAAHEQRAGAAAPTSSPPPPRLRVLDTTVVPPSPAPPGPAAPPECSLPLTFYDILWLHTSPVEHLFLYRLAADADVPTILSNLKDSLSRAVRAFYPLAGRLRLTPGTSTRYELHYRPGDGVSFTVAEYDDHHGHGVEALAADGPREVAAIAPLVPRLPPGGAVLAVQATLLLPARRGLAVGVAVHHAACDGSSSAHFLHTWAASASASSAPPPPVTDRSLVPDPRGLYDAFYQTAPTNDNMQVVHKVPTDRLLATFTLSRDDLQRVKDAVEAEAARRGVAAPPRYTSLVATLGLVWSCYQRAAKQAAAAAAEGSDDRKTCLLFPIDHRPRTKPPLPDTYLGNCVGPAICLARGDELVAAGAGGLLSACAAVAAGIDEAVRGVGTSSMDAWTDRVREVAAGAAGMLSVAGSPRFRVYEVDLLGLGGRPANVDIVSVAKTGALVLAESRRGAGGMEVGVSLPRDGMEQFQKCFAGAIAGLHEHDHHQS